MVSTPFVRVVQPLKSFHSHELNRILPCLAQLATRVSESLQALAGRISFAGARCRFAVHGGIWIILAVRAGVAAANLGTVSRTSPVEQN